MERPLVFLSCGVTTVPLGPLLAPRFTIVLPDGGNAERLCRSGVRTMTWDALADPATLAGLRARATALAARWRATLARRAADVFGFAGRVRDREALALLDADLVARLESQLAALEYGRTLAATGRLAAAIVHEDVTPPVRAFLAGVRAAGVPTVHVPHGLYAADRIVGGDVHGQVATDLVAVGGVVQRDWFVRRGVPAERLVVTGNPAWDELTGVGRAPLPELGGGPVVTIATSWIGFDVAYHAGVRAQHERCTTAAFVAVARLRAARRRLRLVVKLHPSAPATDEERVRGLAAAAGAVPDLVVRDRSPRVLAGSDVLLTLPSTIAVEALLLGTPVVSPEFAYDGDAVLTVPGEADALAAAVTQVLDGWGRSADFAARRRSFVARHNGPCDGRAAERVVQLIDEAIVRLPRDPRRAEDAAGRRARHVAAARLLVGAGNPASALVVLDEAPPARDAAEQAAADTVRGTALVQLHQAGAAESAFRQAIDAGASGAAHAALGLLLLERGIRDEAGVHLRTAVARAPELDAGWSGLGVLAALEGRGAEAVRLLERALGLNPANPDARRALAVLRGEEEVAHEHA